MEFDYSDPARNDDGAVSYERTYHIGGDGVDEWSAVVAMLGGDESEVKNYVCDEFAEFAGELLVSGSLRDVYAEYGQDPTRIQADGGGGVMMLVRFDEFVFESLLIELSLKDEYSHKLECSLTLFVDSEVIESSSGSVVGRGMQDGVQFFEEFFEAFEGDFCEDMFTVDEVQVF